MDRLKSSQVCIYARLKSSLAEAMRADGKNVQQIRNHSSSLQSFMNFLEREDDSPLETDFSCGFEKTLANFAASLAYIELAPATVANRISHLRKIQPVAVRISNLGLIDETFGATLRNLLTYAGMTQKELAERLNVNRSVFNQWIKKNYAPQNDRERIFQQVEEIFNLPSGSLNRRSGKGVSWKIYHPEGTPDTPVMQTRKRLRELSESHYGLKEPPDGLRQEWLKMLHFYTTPYLLNGMDRVATWRLKHTEKTATKRRWYCTVGESICPTAELRWKETSYFMGFLILPTAAGGLGMSVEQLSLALWSNAELVLAFLEFRKNRSGAYNGATKRVLIQCLSILRKETGYLWQTQSFCEKMAEPVEKAEWHSWCENNAAVLKKVLKDLEKGQHIKKTRDPEKPIEAILAMPHPIEAVLGMIDRMEHAAQTCATKAFLVSRKRDVLLVKMLISNPLRVQQYALMTYYPDNSGNLYQDSEGNWRLRFVPEDFKNQRGAANKPYDVTLTKWLYSDIQEYIERYRPMLYGASFSNKVFLPSPQGMKKNVEIIRDVFWHPVHISRAIFALSRRFIPGSPGFGAHAFRHIVATDYIKNNPNGFQVAANILHDRLNTVLKEYAHLQVADGFSFWTTYLDSQIAAFNIQGVAHE